MEYEGSLPCSKQLATGPYPEPVEYSPRLPFLIYILVLSYYINLRLQHGVFPLDFPTKIFTYFSSPPFVLHVPTQFILLDLIILTYLVNSTHYEVLHYVISSVFLLLPVSCVQIFSSALCLETAFFP